ncbi:MAG TPA: type II toxin-antitoxin system HicB family antitoxin [Candidatus Limnocylindrales bacterium]|nr:type II toxin-antitoxin system HicB family antitoxin [Candidatus Limnocylindrales bacterium]
MSLKFPITIKIIYEKESKDAPFVAYIPEFDVSSCGKTEEEAKSNVKEVLEITLETVKKQNKLEEFLKEAGVSVKKPSLFPKISFEPFVFSA